MPADVGTTQAMEEKSVGMDKDGSGYGTLCLIILLLIMGAVGFYFFRKKKKEPPRSPVQLEPGLQPKDRQMLELAEIMTRIFEKISPRS